MTRDGVKENRMSQKDSAKMGVNLRIRPSGSGEGIVQRIGECQVRLLEGASSGEYRFDQVLDDTSSQQDVFERLLKGPLDGCLTRKEDCLVVCCGALGAGSSYTLFGDRETLTLDGILGRALHLVFDKVPAERIVPFRQMARYLGSSLVGNDAGISASAAGKANAPVSTGGALSSLSTLPTTSPSFGFSLSIYEIQHQKIRDLVADRDLGQKLASEFPRSVKDGKLRPAQLAEHHLGSFDHSLQVVKAALMRRNKKSHAVDCIVYVNIYEFKRFNRIRSTRLTLADLAGLETAAASSMARLRDSRHTARTLIYDLPKFLAAANWHDPLLRSSCLYKAVLSDLAKANKPQNLVTIVNLSPHGDVNAAKLVLAMVFPSQKTRKMTPTGLPTGPTTLASTSNVSTKELVSKMENLRLELLETKKKNSVLEHENRQLAADLSTIEQDTRLEVSSHFEQLVDEMHRSSMTSKLEEDELVQSATDEKLEKLSRHFSAKIDKLKQEKLNLKFKLENLKYQNARMDELFHSQLTSISDELKCEFEQKYNEEVEKLLLQKTTLVDDNLVLSQKVQLLTSQLASFKERASTATPEASQLYNKIKSLRLEDEVLTLINKKMKQQLGKEKKQVKNLKSTKAKRSSSLLGDLAAMEANFKIFEDEPKADAASSKRKLVRKEVSTGETSDIDMC